MATYQLGFHAFGALGFVNAAGPAGARLIARTAAGIAFGIDTPGARFRLLDAAAPVTLLQVEDERPAALHGDADTRMCVARDSPFGVAGQPVHLSHRLDVTTDETLTREGVLFLLCIGGVTVGLLGNVPLRAGVDYTVIRAAEIGVADTETPATLRRLGRLVPVSPDLQGQDMQPWNAVLCFTHGTLIDTPDGPRLIEDLRPGDLVTTLDNGSQPLRWSANRAVSAAEMHARPDLRPVRFEIGAHGNQRPLLVSPQHRMLLGDWRAEVYFGEDQVLVAAKAMENDTTIRTVIPEAGVVYCHLLLDRHEVILAEGALSESFHPGEAGLGSLDRAQRQEIAALFPHLPVERRRAAFPIVKPSEARALRMPG